MFQKLSSIQVDANICLHACDEELNTIVQDIHGNEYVVTHEYANPMGKYWRLYDLQPYTEYEVMEILVAENLCALDHAKKIAPPQPQPRKKKGEPVRPKQNGYIKFMSDELKKMSVTHPNLSNKAKMALVAEMWQNMK